MKARMNQPAMVLPGTMDALLALGKTLEGTGLPARTVHLVHLRASQINGCSYCVEMHAREALDEGDTIERVVAVGAWRESRRFTDAERAALALTEEVTRIADRPDAVSDEVWDTVADHYDEQQLAALTMQIAMINLWNRLNATVRQPAGVAPRD
ncbi:carboxymuconolactone decarboxylase family protein [Rhodococcus sp. D2-41]|uniref:Carboxymuconolactone decarboxylase family protein n=1 Tax=Speluncibacter jeojiensis TaxID=2710754 RepID=A0A9X4REA7_9ACTN|nr:carboxymuconolactone decarboxylase family protein [Rhodococcus sp. D2-41]MDG3012753.1 carboxymuconolactone decarboxylase family protein [Rhodococcus sp. D2-41]MDG3015428.1 carboxymuconolactone decarboxylase family protein [Corynebacteriales bacterium D3-21]